MKPYIKIYLETFGYSVADFIGCEVCEAKAVDIHHIDARGKGGDPYGEKDVPENLMALCRKCHVEYGDITDLKDKLKELHNNFMKSRGIHT